MQPEMGLSSSHGAAHAIDLREGPADQVALCVLELELDVRLSAASVSAENTVTWPIPDVRQSRVAPIEQDGALGSVRLEHLAQSHHLANASRGLLVGP